MSLLLEALQAAEKARQRQGKGALPPPPRMAEPAPPPVTPAPVEEPPVLPVTDALPELELLELQAEAPPVMVPISEPVEEDPSSLDLEAWNWNSGTSWTPPETSAPASSFAEEIDWGADPLSLESPPVVEDLQSEQEQPAVPLLSLDDHQEEPVPTPLPDQEPAETVLAVPATPPPATLPSATVLTAAAMTVAPALRPPPPAKPLVALLRDGQAKARQILSAKKTAPAFRRQHLLFGFGMAAVLMAAAGGWYVYQSVTALSTPRVVRRVPPPRPLPVLEEEPAPPVIASPPAPVAEPVVASPPPVAPVPETPAPPVQAVVPMPVKSEPPPREVAALPPEPATPDPPPREKVVEKKPRPEPPPPAEVEEPAKGGIRIRHGAGDKPVVRGIREAYQAYQQGKRSTSRQIYREVLQQEPDNRDALLGMASLEMLEGHPGPALAFYQRVLEGDPTDSTALAGVTALGGGGDLEQSESRLKNLLAKNPSSPQLHFALGSLYAGRSLWSEAQGAYFNAYHLDRENGDTAFNLAVSLDQLGQRKLAMRFYEESLHLASRGPVAFDPQSAIHRLTQLKAAGDLP